MSAPRSLQLYRYRIPLRTPLALRGIRLEERQGLILQLLHGDTEHFGEVAPLPGFSRESLADAQAEVLRLARHWQQGQPVTGSPLPSVAFGIDCVRCGVPGYGPHQTAVPLLSGAPEKVHQRLAALMAAQAPATVKLKVARIALEEEIALVRRIAADFPGLRLRLDANRGWNETQALTFARAVPRQAIDYIEEPLIDPATLPGWFAAGGLPYALDETLQQPDYRFAPQPGLCALVIKPTLVGGWARIGQLMKAARRAGVPSVLSSAYESSLGLQLLAALAGRWTPAQPPGLDTHEALCQDLLWRWPTSPATKPCLRLSQLEPCAHLELPA